MASEKVSGGKQKQEDKGMEILQFSQIVLSQTVTSTWNTGSKLENCDCNCVLAKVEKDTVVHKWCYFLCS